MIVQIETWAGLHLNSFNFVFLATGTSPGISSLAASCNYLSIILSAQLSQAGALWPDDDNAVDDHADDDDQ